MLVFFLAHNTDGYWLTAAWHKQHPHSWKSSSPEMTFITRCQQPSPQPPQFAVHSLQQIEPFCLSLLFTLPKEERNEKKKALKHYCIQPFEKQSRTRSTIVSIFPKHHEKINSNIPLQTHDAFANEDSFEFHLLALGLF